MHEELVGNILDVLRKDVVYWTAKRAAKEEVIKPKYRDESVLGAAVRQTLRTSGSLAQLRRVINTTVESLEKKRHEKSDFPAPILEIISQSKENSQLLRRERKKWGNFLKEQLLSISKEQGVVLLRRRTERTEEQRRMREERIHEVVATEKGSESEFDGEDANGTDFNDLFPPIRSVYNSSSLLEASKRIHNENNRSSSSRILGWGLLEIELATPGLEDFHSMLSGLSLDQRHIGADDNEASWFVKQQKQMCDDAVSMGSRAIGKKLSRKGIPDSCRPEMWKMILGVDLRDKDREYFERLREHVQTVEMLSDDIIRLDVFVTANNDNYFIFEESLEIAMLSFTRDVYVKDNLSAPVIFVRAKDSDGKDIGPYPPNGIVPFEGVSLLAAPLCFLYDEIEDIYFVFRQLFCRYFCKLQTLSSDSECFLGLCKIFENLVQIHIADAQLHVQSMGVNPLDIAAPWIFCAFSGYLEVKQLFLLWDRILGYDSLILIPVLAAALFAFRRDAILESESAREVRMIMGENSRIMVIPVLQQFLFGEIL